MAIDMNIKIIKRTGEKLENIENLFQKQKFILESLFVKSNKTI